MAIARRQTLLTLARLEWNAIIHHLESSPRTSRATAPALAALRAKLSQSTSGLDEFVTISQAPLEWSPVILALSLNVLEKPDLLPLAERLRDQMSAQSTHMESRISPQEMSAGMRRLNHFPDDVARRLTSTN